MSFKTKVGSAYVVAATPFLRDAMSQFETLMKGYKFVKSTKRHQIGSDKVETVDISTKDGQVFTAVSYTHLTLPTNREV